MEEKYMFNKFVENINEAVRNLEVKILGSKLLKRTIGGVGLLGIILMKPAYAAPAVGQNGATYVLEQLSWLILGATVFLAVKAYTKNNMARLVVVAILGGVVYALCKNPTKIQTFGTWVFEIFGI